ncbi:hypothetical protein EDD52_101322 [Primorskyibacter sedentarius]|uniref:DUF2155 domain-containing protein n=1 Tax=Primorskyibacter sedentarius TaxID=745311 RepID=A0A4R3JLJ9_9RHOB|nr:DUF2155 domain-containing protein [Primorskyibacter sedentarius]TCS67227.1 hypothetical protein EDD52_101322 [Primorskyibacter sedentarius]
MIRAVLLSLALAAPAAAQEQVNAAPGAVLRGLDKVSGAVSDLDLRNGERGGLGRLTITLRECRYPAGDPAGNAYAYLDIVEEGRQEPVFSGWMVASAPALNPLDHARYDVWVLRCKTS